MSPSEIRTISVVAPVRGEGDKVGCFVADSASQDFGGELEVLVADTDTATFGAFPPDAFARPGLSDETLIRNPDDECNLRLGRACDRIVLDPERTVRAAFSAIHRACASGQLVGWLRALGRLRQ
jgi:hypothetical protein